METNLTQAIANAITVLIPMILSLTVHEYSHARAAHLLGDDTAKLRGRLTLNPVAHADIIGTIVLPLMILVGNGMSTAGGLPFFGWAIPVPVDPGRFRRTIPVRQGMMLVAFAGPLSNLVLALMSAGVLSVLVHMNTPLAISMVSSVQLMFGINIGLFVFNMLPIYPLDGQKVISGLMGGPTAIAFERFSQRYGMMLLFALIFLGRGLLQAPMIWVANGVLGVFGL